MSSEEHAQLPLFDDSAQEPQKPTVARRYRGRARRQPTEMWPDAERFPHNDQSSGQSVGEIVLDDLKRSREPLIISGYSSLDQIVQFLADRHTVLSNLKSLRILLGHEPNLAPRKEYRKIAPRFDQDIEAYWLDRGISLYLSADIFAAIRVLEDPRVEIRISGNRHEPVHAKVFCGEQAITIGSSNFSTNGLRIQVEYNTRFTPADGKRYLEARQGGERIWSGGSDYKAGLQHLLEQLLREVDWREALARACAELLDGRWAQRYIIRDDVISGARAWPSQQQSLAQAMYIIENVGSVLIADAAGSGKTFTGAHVLRAVVNRVWGSGTMRNPNPVVIAPPKTLPKWREETRNADLFAELLSTGQLRGDEEAIALLTLQRAQVLAIDEAHNFLNVHSQRTKLVLRNVADHVILMTATPINREAADLLKLINLLGPDNFDDNVLQLLEELLHPRRGRAAKGTERRKHGLTKEEISYLQTQIDKFTLRRTRVQFNAMIAVEPERYRNRFGRLCRYPAQQTNVYPTEETPDDASNAEYIRASLRSLRGMMNIGVSLEVPDTRAWRTLPNPDQTFLDLVMRGAHSLAVHNILASLRSSRAALLEHVLGTANAWPRTGMLGEPSKQLLRGVLPQLEEKAGHIPVNHLRVALPDWLSDPEAHRQASDEEQNIYRLIATFAERISLSREQGKAQLLAHLLHTHRLVVAFDRRLITLVHLEQLLHARNVKTVLATSQNARAVAEALRLFALGSDAQGYVALCSESMAEGVNMQAASALVHLDMPTVIRVLEQRDGRISRMDSDNREIWTYLPKDGSSFITRADELLHERSLLVRDLIGANVEIPAELIPESADDVDVQDTPEEGMVAPERILARWQHARTLDENLPDAFSPIRALVDGPAALVPANIYQHYRRVPGRVLASTSISLVEAERPWAFFAVEGSELGAPRFIFLDDQQTQPVIDLSSVCEALRAHLRPDTPRRAYDEGAAVLLNEFLSKIVEQEELLLPLKKRRALEQMRTVLNIYLRDSSGKQRVENDINAEDAAERRQVIESILDLVEHPGPRLNDDGTERIAVDVSMVAERWMHIVRPVWYRVLRDRPSLKLLLLKHLREPLLRQPLPTSDLNTILVNEALWIRPLDERVVAAIVGVAGTVVM